MLVLRSVQLEITQKFIKDVPQTEAAGIILAIFIGSVIICYLWSFIVSKIPVIKKIL
jgi:hypothetical protein